MFKGKTRKIALAALCLSLLLLGTVGSVSAAKITIKWYSVPGNHLSYQQTFESMMDEFRKKFPDVDLQIKYSDSSLDQMLIGLAGGAPPDIVTMGGESVGPIQAGLFAPVDPTVFGASSVQDLKSKFIPGALETLLINGQLYYMPNEMSVFSLYVNRDLLENTGYGKAPATWEELIEMGSRIRKVGANGAYDRVVMGNPETWIGSSFMWPTVMRQNGIDWLDKSGKANFNHTKAVEALQVYNDMFKADIVPANANAYSLFSQGKAAVKIGGSYELFDLVQSKLPFELGTAPLPYLKDGKPVTMAYALGNFVLASSKHQKLAWQIVDFFTGPDRAAAWFSRALFIPWQGKWINDAITKYPLYKTFLAAFAQAEPEVLHPYSPDINAAIMKAQASIIGGKQSVAQALSQLDQQVQTILEKPKKTYNKK